MGKGATPWAVGWSNDGALLAWGNTYLHADSRRGDFPLERTFSLENLESQIRRRRD